MVCRKEERQLEKEGQCRAQSVDGVIAVTAVEFADLVLRHGSGKSRFDVSDLRREELLGVGFALRINPKNPVKQGHQHSRAE